MKDVVINEVVEVLSQKHNKKEALIKIMLEKSLKLEYNVKNQKRI